MVILPVTEKMNDGKTHAYFSWAANHSWVPPLYFDHFDKVPTNLTYANVTTPAPSLAVHDPVHAHLDQFNNSSPRPWVRPDFVVKADDDSFVMLAELEARLRVELYKDPLPPPQPPIVRKQTTSPLNAREDTENAQVVKDNQISAYFNFSLPSYLSRLPPVLAAAAPAPVSPSSPLSMDPLVFWGYLVKNRLHQFMAGELYALTWALVDWVAKDPTVKTMTRGAEDKQTAKWIKSHPQADEIRWASERCYMYDHPRAGTVYVFSYLMGRSGTNIGAATRMDSSSHPKSLG